MEHFQSTEPLRRALLGEIHSAHTPGPETLDHFIAFDARRIARDRRYAQRWAKELVEIEMKPRETDELLFEVGDLRMCTAELIDTLRLASLERFIIALENLGHIRHGVRRSSHLRFVLGGEQP
jgi:hypothetical protein